MPTNFAVLSYRLIAATDRRSASTGLCGSSSPFGGDKGALEDLFKVPDLNRAYQEDMRDPWVYNTEAGVYHTQPGGGVLHVNKDKDLVLSMHSARVSMQPGRVTGIASQYMAGFYSGHLALKLSRVPGSESVSLLMMSLASMELRAALVPADVHLHVIRAIQKSI